MKNLQTDVNIKDLIRMEKCTGKVNIYGKMANYIKESGQII